MQDKFSPDGNPQDRATIINPSNFLPAGFTPIYNDEDDANATLDAVADATRKLQQGGGTWNEVTNSLLAILGTALGATKAITL